MPHRKPIEPPLLLHVDDNDDEAVLLEAALRAARLAFRVRYVPSGDDAITYFEKYAGTDLFPDLVLLDLNMPRMTGFEVLEWIRERFRNLPVIIHSSSDLAHDLARARDLGATLYLVKSATNQDLIACLKRSNKRFAVLRRCPASSALTRRPSGAIATITE